MFCNNNKQQLKKSQKTSWTMTFNISHTFYWRWWKQNLSWFGVNRTNVLNTYEKLSIKYLN